MGTSLIVGAQGWIGRAVTARAQEARLDVRAAGRGWTDSFMHAYAAGSAPAQVGGVFSIVNCASTGAQPEELSSYVALSKALADFSRVHGIRYVHLGSAAEYGDPGLQDAREDDPANPITAYGQIKLETSTYAVQRGGVALRVFNVIGREQPPHTIVGDWVGQLARHDAQIFVGNPDLVRDFVGLDFIAEVVVSAAVGSLGPGLFNVCSGRASTFGEVASSLLNLWGSPGSLVFGSTPGIPRVVGDSTRLKQLGLVECRSARELLMLALDQ